VQPQPQPNQGAQPQAPRGNPVFREFCRMNLPTFEERMSQVEELWRNGRYYGEQRPCLHHGWRKSYRR
ncbi:hypothetical protein A2U01_0083697, partial [Trifolium medium]|nr:hypothetical protein [Trifolium medium]